MGEVVLALLEGQDPVEADKRAAKVERQWIYHTAMLHPGTDISAETARVLYTSVRDKDH